MTEEGDERHTDGERRTAAIVHRTRWPGWIWAVPLAALAIVAWLIARHFANEGPEVTVTFPTADGVQADDTKARYRGIEVGRVQSVKLASDLSHIVVTVRMKNQISDALRDGTRFWLSKPELNDLSSLKSVVSGPTIEMDPGPGKPRRDFTGLDQPPQVLTGTAGVELSLHSDSLGSLKAGSTIRYRGLEVGTVERTALSPGGNGFDVTVFVKAPFDSLVHEDSRFWNASALQLSTGGNGISAHLPSVPALISGAIAFETPDPAAALQAKPGAHFTLFTDEDAAKGAPLGPQVPFLVRFDGAVGDLKPGAAVTLKGFRVGQVTAVKLAYDAHAERLQTPVTIEIEPARLTITNAAPPADGNWTPQMTTMLEKLVRDGLRARLERSTPVIGGKAVVLDFVPEAKPAKLTLGAPLPEIPTAPSGEIQEITSEAHAVMAKIDSLPLNDIGENLRSATHRIDSLAASPQVRQSLDHLESALANVDRVSQTASRDIGPVVASLRQTADAAQQTVASAGSVLGGSGAEQNRNIPHALEELSDAARSIRELADYLEQHPEALIQGRSRASQ